ncbi:MAG: sigma-70 family RNA polymerase sigma factor [Bacteroides sp.]|nr:sigma-70 family RNA polymerase sigma factor [Roseburia sp.]MCM1346344.1 sigma-70 family RNA polymerase sigma factor [Bacteroides sp.]MCM1420279.1 sigma-70 family RNA polymerase sigma factor [Bacteroides sp.]
METNIKHENRKLIASAFETYKSSLMNYVFYRIKDKEECEDIVQDVFLHLLEVGDTVCATTVRSFIFTIAQNIIIDRLRRNMKRVEVYSYIYDRTPLSTENTEETVCAHSLEQAEKTMVANLPEQRRKIYLLNRYEGKSVGEIASLLSLSTRTIESHLFQGRRMVRTYLRNVCGY